ncbi:MAG: cytidine/deoxycytidylate deaminase family protein [Patescibacteria group bacterium]
MPKAKVSKEEKYQRPSWDEYFMEVMEAISKRATCDRGRSGCVIAKDNQIVATGYVGSAAGDDHCDQVGHMYQKKVNPDGSITEHCVRTIHAEQNAICQAARRGISINGATVYCRMEPCPVCAKMMINSGIKRVVAQKRYHAAGETRRVFAKCEVVLEVVEDEVMKYEKM